MSSSIQPILSRIARWLLGTILAFAMLLSIALSVIFVILQDDPQNLVDKYLAEFGQRYGLQFQIGFVDITLLPMPAMTLGDVRITGSNLAISVGNVTASPSFLGLLQGNVLPGEIGIAKVEIHVATAEPLLDFKHWRDKIASLFTSDGQESFFLPGGIHINVSRSDMGIYGGDGLALLLVNAYADLDLHQLGDLTGQVDFSSLSLVNGQKTLLASVENFHLRGETNCFNWRSDANLLEIKGLLRYPGVLRNLDIDLYGTSENASWKVQSSVRGDLDLGEPVPFAFKAHAAGVIGDPYVRISQGMWQLGEDSGTANLALYCPGEISQSAVGGIVTAHRLSLTEWFGFARNLAPGLQISLDNITDAQLEFLLNAHTLKVPKIAASCTGATFTGSGGVADFRHPVVELELASPDVNLGLAVPESIGEVPDDVYYPHPPLTPMPGEPLKPGEEGIGYDIRLSANLLRYGPLQIQKAKLRIYPGKMDKIRLEDVLLDATAQFYGGSLSGHCILGADPSLPIYINCKASKVNSNPMSKAMPLLPMRKGIWNASIILNTRGKKLKPFLANMRGDVKITATNATLSATGAKNILDSLTVFGTLRTAAWNGKQFSLDGAYLCNIANKDYSTSGDLRGKLLFDSDGLAFSSLPGTIAVNTRSHAWPAAKLTGIFSVNTGKNRYELASGTIQMADATIQCDGVFDAARTILKGKFKTNIADPQATLAKFGTHINLPKFLRPLKIAATYQIDENSCRLSQIDSTLGKLSINGDIVSQFKSKRPTFNVNIRLGKIVITDFFSKHVDKPNWNFSSLTGFDADGNVKCTSLDIYGQSVSNITVPFSMNNGVLNIKNLHANFYGAPLQGNVNANFQRGLIFNVDMKVNAFDLEKAARDRDLDIRLTGLANFTAKANATLIGSDKITEKIQGSWQLSVNNGSWQSQDKKGKLKGKPTYFKNASASGGISGGVISSSNFILHGSDIDIDGKGSFNIPKEELNCNFNVDLKGLPAFPLRVYGPLAKIKTSIGAGKMLVNAVTDVASGITGAVGGMLKGAWNLFRGK